MTASKPARTEPLCNERGCLFGVGEKSKQRHFLARCSGGVAAWLFIGKKNSAGLFIPCASLASVKLLESAKLTRGEQQESSVLLASKEERKRYPTGKTRAEDLRAIYGGNPYPRPLRGIANEDAKPTAGVGSKTSVGTGDVAEGVSPQDPAAKVIESLPVTAENKAPAANTTDVENVSHASKDREASKSPRVSVTICGTV